MTNAELIKVLRCCIVDFNSTQSRRCNECPYRIYADGKKACENKAKRDAADALEAADKRIAELEAQLPKTGRWVYHDDDDMRFDTIHCSVCKKMFTVDAERFDDIGFVKEDLKYCPNCGSFMKEGGKQ